MMDRLERIAARVYLAFSGRRYLYNSGFGYDGADRGVVRLDYRYWPVAWCYLKDGVMKLVHAKKLKEVAEACLRTPEETGGEVGDAIRKAVPNGMKAVRQAVLRIIDNGMSPFEGAGFMVDWTEEMDFGEARDFLTRNWGMSLVEFRMMFGGEPEEARTFSCFGMNFEVNDSSVSRDDIVKRMEVVGRLLPKSLAGKLMYGDVELRKGLNKDAGADYSPHVDVIRVGESSNFLEDMVHELGHRWHYKFATGEQLKSLERLYRLCRNDPDSPVSLSVGDVVKFRGLEADNGLKVLELDGNGHATVENLDAPEGSERRIVRGMSIASFFTRKMVRSINGKGVRCLHLPREYAGKNFKEFVACCFEDIYYWRQFGNSGKALTKVFRLIVEKGTRLVV